MATTVNNAFAEFMRDIVNLDPDIVYKARMSRDNLLDNIAEFDNKDGFLICVIALMYTLVHLREEPNAVNLMM